MKILYFSSVNWRWIKQRPHFISQYLSENGIDITYFSMTPLFKQKIFNKRINESLYINDRYVIPYSSKFDVIKKINKLYINLFINKNYDIVILTHPDQYYYLPNKLKEKCKIIYECMDNIPYFYNGKIKEDIMKKEYDLCKKVHKIIVSSNYLKEKVINKYSVDCNKVDVIKNAVDDINIDNNIKGVALKHPNLMYIGTVSNWLDLKILNKFARKNPQYTIYIIGPVEKKRIINIESNIILLGAIKHEQVKEYILSGDIMLIPFIVNELIKAVDPVKMYEYLAFNKPVLTSYWQELDSFSNCSLVNYYNNYNMFELGVRKIQEEKHDKFIINDKFIKENNWKERSKEYIKILNRIE